jgi:DNA-binding winged helix-turn-helix (wHTH) protein
LNRISDGSVRRFGSFELDLDAGRLRRKGRAVRIRPQPFKLLCLLTDRPGTLVTREQIRAALWPGDTFVDFEQGVNFAVRQVREALGDRGEDPRYIETVPRQGYRFVAPIEPGPERLGLEQAEAWVPAIQRALWENIAELRLADKRTRRRQTILGVALAGVIVVFVVRWLLGM